MDVDELPLDELLEPVEDEGFAAPRLLPPVVPDLLIELPLELFPLELELLPLELELPDAAAPVGLSEIPDPVNPRILFIGTT